MSFESIKIYRDLPVVNGYIQVPPCREKDKTTVTLDEALALYPSGTTVRLSLGSGKVRGSKCGQQEFLRLAGIAPNEWYVSDPVANLIG